MRYVAFRSAQGIKRYSFAKDMNKQTKWTDADFDQLSWHDGHINSIAFDQTGEWQSDLVLGLDFIVEWLCGPDKTCRFRIAPAILRFTNVNNLKLHFSLQFKEPLEISSVERTEIPTEGYRQSHWTIVLQHYPELKENYIQFDATGFAQELTGNVIETESQNLTESQRKESKEGRRTTT